MQAALRHTALSLRSAAALSDRLPAFALPLQDADDAKKMIEAEGSEVLLLPADLSEGDATCQKIVGQVGPAGWEEGVNQRAAAHPACLSTHTHTPPPRTP